MIKLFQIYKNHRRFLLLKKTAVKDLEELLSSVETRNAFISRCEDVDFNQSCIKNYLVGAMHIYFVFEPIFPIGFILDSTKISARLYIQKLIIAIKGL